MLRGARGNSGVILSLLFRGISKGLEGREEISAEDLVAALELGVEEAYKAVMKPTEGTILTVARVAAERGREALELGSDPVQVWDAACMGAADASGGHPRAAARAEKGRRGGRWRPGPVPDLRGDAQRVPQRHCAGVRPLGRGKSPGDRRVLPQRGGGVRQRDQLHLLHRVRGGPRPGGPEGPPGTAAVPGDHRRLRGGGGRRGDHQDPRAHGKSRRRAAGCLAVWPAAHGERSRT